MIRSLTQSEGSPAGERRQAFKLEMHAGFKFTKKRKIRGVRRWADYLLSAGLQEGAKNERVSGGDPQVYV